MADFTPKPTWIIDPIDGTMNFVHSNPMVSISVALAVNRKIVIGIVSLPLMNQVYSARRDKGAKMNGKPIKVRFKKNVLTKNGPARFMYCQWLENFFKGSSSVTRRGVCCNI